MQFEEAWKTLRVNLEWSTGFKLVYVFCSDSHIKQALFERADDLMRVHVRPFWRIGSGDDPAQLAAHLLPQLLEARGNPLPELAPVWVDLDTHPTDPSWNEARSLFLQRLNERRSQWVAHQRSPVVMAFAQSATKSVAQAAPDLWTIRAPTVYVEANSTQDPTVVPFSKSNYSAI